MLSDRFLIELRSVIQAQNQLIQKLDSVVSEVENQLSNMGEQTEQIRELEMIMAELETSVNWLEEEDLADFEIEEILQLYESRQVAISQELIQIGYDHWDDFVYRCQVYALNQGFDPLAPYEGILRESDLERLKKESYENQYHWDQWDYIWVGSSGILAALTDYFLVKIPATIKTGQYADQLGSPLTAWLKSYNICDSNDWFAQWAKSLEKICKTPYDSQQLISGMNPTFHRFQSLGHDPILGFIFGVLDILRGSITGFSYDKLTGVHQFCIEPVSSPESIKLIEALLKHIGHLVSDLATPMGLPAPLMTLFQGINLGSFGEDHKTVGQIARWMYGQGYDLRHFLVSGITPAVIEMVLRAYLMLKHYSEFGETKFDLASHPKYRSMLLAAHSIATLGNCGKIALMQGNPLAINYAQWLALFRYLMPTVKYWLFDSSRLRLEYLETINDQEWDNLLENSDKILAIVAQTDDRLIPLGRVVIPLLP